MVGEKAMTSGGGLRWLGTTAQTAIAGILLAVSLTGCDHGEPAKLPIEENVPAPSTGESPGSPATAATDDPLLHQSFAEATRQDAPDDWQPPDVTKNGKSVGKLYTEVVRDWNSVKFTSAKGKPIAYTVKLDTELGPIEIEMRPDLAPNHVRNFLVLAGLGYYDGLVFERTIHARSDVQPDAEVEIIEGGCPLGTGDTGTGSIGYWLKPEFSKEPHDVGTVGAPHGEDVDTAGCRFYITLNKAPWLDGHFTVFGKVTQGLDTARKIFSLPVRNDPEYPELDRPQNPVVIRKVTIQTSER
jgi:cyclophilin family peptidyl-prolyl cis-trans isomerase